MDPVLISERARQSAQYAQAFYRHALAAVAWTAKNDVVDIEHYVFLLPASVSFAASTSQSS